MSQGDHSYRETYDSLAWAKAFVKEVKENPIIAFDEECMDGWFRGALYTGFETGRKHTEEKNNGKSA